MNNKFYWIKLKTDFFRREEIDFLLSQTNGAEYVVLYQMLCLNTVNTSGKLETKIGEMIVPYNAKKIARDCKYFDIDTINVAMNLYKKLGLIYEEENKILKISEYDELVGAETTWAKKKRLYREKKNQKMIEYKDIGEDKHRDIEKDINVDMQVDNVLKKSENEDIEEDIVREENRDKRLEYKSIDNNSLFSFLEKEMNRTLNFLEVEKIENKTETKQNQNENKIETHQDVNVIVNDNVNNLEKIGCGEEKPLREIVDYLNQKTGSHFRYTGKTTQMKINARLNEGYKLDDFIAVIDKKCAEWTGTEFEKYLEPETLFGPKFEKYLNQKVPSQKENDEELELTQEQKEVLNYDWLNEEE